MRVSLAALTVVLSHSATARGFVPRRGLAPARSDGLGSLAILGILGGSGGGASSPSVLGPRGCRAGLVGRLQEVREPRRGGQVLPDVLAEPQLAPQVEAR